MKRSPHLVVDDTVPADDTTHVAARDTVAPVSRVRLSESEAAVDDEGERSLDVRIAALGAIEDFKHFARELHTIAVQVLARLAHDAHEDGAVAALVIDEPRLEARLGHLSAGQQRVRVALFALQRQALAGAPARFVERHLRLFRASWRRYMVCVDALFQDAYVRDLGVAG
jgi:hypothetical protein